MTKKKSRGLFVVFSIILAILLIASFFSFTYPFTIKGNYYRYSSFIENFSLGEDVGKSVRIVYRANYEQDGVYSYNKLRQSTIEQLKQIVTDAGYPDVTAAEYGDDGISLQIGNMLTRADEQYIQSLIGNPQPIIFCASSDKTTPFATRQDVKSVTMLQSADGVGGTSYGITITFKDKQKILDKITDDSGNISGNLYVYLGDATLMNGNMSLDSESLREQGQITFTSTSFTNANTTQQYINTIRTGLLDLNLTQLECNTVSASYGANAGLLLTIALFVFVLATFIYAIIKYRQLGWLSAFTLLFFITISMFIMQSIPLLHINFGGFIALAIGFIVAADSLFSVLAGAKEYYNNDTKLYIAITQSRKDNLIKTLISNLLLTVVGAICVLMPVAGISSFGWVMLIMSVVSLFTSLVLFRLFTNMYLPLNSYDGKKCNFHKGGKNDK